MEFFNKHFVSSIIGVKLDKESIPELRFFIS